MSKINVIMLMVKSSVTKYYQYHEKIKYYATGITFLATVSNCDDTMIPCGKQILRYKE